MKSRPSLLDDYALPLAILFTIFGVAVPYLWIIAFVFFLLIAAQTLFS